MLASFLYIAKLSLNIIYERCGWVRSVHAGSRSASDGCGHAPRTYNTHTALNTLTMKITSQVVVPEWPVTNASLSAREAILQHKLTDANSSQTYGIVTVILQL